MTVPKWLCVHVPASHPAALSRLDVLDGVGRTLYGSETGLGATFTPSPVPVVTR